MKTSSEITPPPTKRRRIGEAESLLLAPSISPRPITELGQRLRIFAWNINGIRPFLQPAITSYFTSASRSTDHRETTPESSDSNRSASLRACLERWKYPQILCLQEVKISSQDDWTKRAVQQAVRLSCNKNSSPSNQETGYRTFFNLPTDKFNARGFSGKLYGVCTLIREDLFEKDTNGKDAVLPVSWDNEGRVLILELSKRKLAVFNVYAVNGTENLYRSPKSGAVIGTRHSRKRDFHTELMNACKSYEDRRWDVVIAGDLNIARNPIDGFPGIRLGDPHVTNRADFNTKFMCPEEAGGLNMTDTYRSLHGEERKYSFRPRGIPWGSSCDRVDMILISHNLSPNLLEADILDDEAERGPSDHVPLYITLAAD